MKIKLEESEKKQGIKAFARKLKWPLEEAEVRRVLLNLRNVSETIDRAQGMDTTLAVKSFHRQRIY